MVQRRSVLLVFGGQSSEHGVSCLTASEVVRAVDPARFDVHPIGIAADGTWVHYTPDEVAALAITDGELPSVDRDHEVAVLAREGDVVELARRTSSGQKDAVRIDVAFALLHGAFGEDGTVQGAFEMLGLPYVGSGVAASANGLDKHLMKVMLAAAGVPIGHYDVIGPGQWAADPDGCRERVDALTYPLYVKPARGGSSLGITRISSPDELDAAMVEALRYDPKVVVEEGFVGVREVECAVLGPRGDGPVRVAPPGEIVMHTPDAFYDFEAKYTPDGQVSLEAPAKVPSDTLATLYDIAERAFVAMGSAGLARVDTFVLPTGEVYVNEINTMPGFTSLSMFPRLWDVAGLAYPDLIADLIDQALERGTGLH